MFFAALRFHERVAGARRSRLLRSRRLGSGHRARREHVTIGKIEGRFRTRGVKIVVAGVFIELALLGGVKGAVSPGLGCIPNREPPDIPFEQLEPGEILFRADIR